MNTSLHTLDGNKLKSIANASYTAEVVMTSLALRERVRGFSDITRTKTNLIRDKEKIIDSDYIKFWKSLEAAGVGSIHHPRPGDKDKNLKFEWHYSLRHIAEAALEGKDVKAERILLNSKASLSDSKKAPVKSAMVKENEAVNGAKEVSVGNNEKMVYIPLRSNFHLSIKVPADFSKDEADILAKALRSISI